MYVWYVCMNACLKSLSKLPILYRANRGMPHNTILKSLMKNLNGEKPYREKTLEEKIKRATKEKNNVWLTPHNPGSITPLPPGKVEARPEARPEAKENNKKKDKKDKKDKKTKRA